MVQRSPDKTSLTYRRPLHRRLLQETKDLYPNKAQYLAKIIRAEHSLLKLCEVRYYRQQLTVPLTGVRGPSRLR